MGRPKRVWILYVPGAGRRQNPHFPMRLLSWSLRCHGLGYRCRRGDHDEVASSLSGRAEVPELPPRVAGPGLTTIDPGNGHMRPGVSPRAVSACSIPVRLRVERSGRERGVGT